MLSSRIPWVPILSLLALVPRVLVDLTDDIFLVIAIEDYPH